MQEVSDQDESSSPSVVRLLYGGQTRTKANKADLS